jgi:hypothetical protein
MEKTMSVTITAPNALSNLAADGAGLGAVLAALSFLPDAAHAALPDAWRNLSASLVGMIVDEEMAAADVADATGLPLEAIRAFAFNLELV